MYNNMDLSKDSENCGLRSMRLLSEDLEIYFNLTKWQHNTPLRHNLEKGFNSLGKIKHKTAAVW